MPTYQNNSGKRLTASGMPTLNPGQAWSTLKYLVSPPVGIDLISHEPFTHTPEQIHSGPLPTDVITGLPEYKYLLINNMTGSPVSCQLNENPFKVLVIPTGTFIELELQGDYYSMEITGEGESNLYVWGLR